MNNNFVLLATLICLNLPWNCQAKTPPVTITLQAQRNYGYTLGDEIKLTALINTRAGYQLESGFIQQPGPINNWLLLKEHTLTKDVDGYDYGLQLTYQIFKAEKNSTEISIPPLPLQFDNSNKQITIKMPAWTFSYHPLIPAQIPDLQLVVQAPVIPPLLNAAEHYPVLCGLFFCIVALLVYLAWIYDKLPFLENYTGPFGVACKQLKALSKQHDSSGKNLQQALQIFHHALNGFAGVTVFSEHLDDFFNQNSSFQPAKKITEQLFKTSQQMFFSVANQTESDTKEMSVQGIYLLCQQYRKIARAGRWT